MLNLSSPNKKVTAVKLLTVTVLLSLGRESTTRDYTVTFSKNAVVDEEQEAMKVAALSRKKYTSIMRLGGNATVLSSNLQLVD